MRFAAISAALVEWLWKRAAAPFWVVIKMEWVPQMGGEIRPVVLQSSDRGAGTVSMKRKHQMSLIVRRAQIRRAAAGRKDAAPPREAGAPKLRLVFSNSNLEPFKAASGNDGPPRSFE